MCIKEKKNQGQWKYYTSKFTKSVSFKFLLNHYHIKFYRTSNFVNSNVYLTCLTNKPQNGYYYKLEIFWTTPVRYKIIGMYIDT